MNQAQTIPQPTALAKKVIAATGPNAHPRLAQIMPSLVRHLHEFVRDVGLTFDEWTMAINLICGIPDLETLVDETTANLLSEGAATPSAILGPFYRQNAPFFPSAYISNAGHKPCHIDSAGPNTHPRLLQIMPSLMRHLHEFVRDVGLTFDEWTMAIKLLNECNCQDETQLLGDILGLETLVDEIAANQLPEEGGATPSAILGPFYRKNAPLLAKDSSIIQNLTPSCSWYQTAIQDSAYITGCVISSATSQPIPNAILDVWHTAPNGLYEQQDSDQPDMNLRGRFETDSQGRYAFRCLRPVAYPIPNDGPAGKFLDLLDRHPYRPGHIHFIVLAEGHYNLTTQIFDDRDEYLKKDSVFAVKEELIVKFVPRKGDPKCNWGLEYNFTLRSRAIAS